MESVVLCGMWPLTSGEMHELSELYISQLKTCPSSTHLPSQASQFSEGSCPTNTELLLERLGFGEIEKRRLYMLRLHSYFLLSNGLSAEMLHFVCGERGCRDAATRSVYGL